MRTILFATLLLVACGSPKGPTDTDSSSGTGSSSATGTADAPTGGCVDDPPVLVVGNGTKYTFTSLSYAECDSEAIEATAVPLPDGGLIPAPASTCRSQARAVTLLARRTAMVARAPG